MFVSGKMGGACVINLDEDVGSVPEGDVSISEIKEFLNRQAEEWKWLTELASSGAAATVRDAVAGKFQELRGVQRQAASQGMNQARLLRAARTAFESGPLVYSGSPFAHLLTQVREDFSDEAAAFTYGVRKGVIGLGDARTIDEFRTAIRISYPGLSEATTYVNMLQRERANARSTVRSLIKEGSDANEKRAAEWEVVLDEANRRALEWAAIRNKRWRIKRRMWEERHSTAISSIKAVEASYKESMALQAPVDYWTRKAGRHQESEHDALVRLCWFFPIAFVAVLALFGAASFYILSLPPDDIPAGVYVVFSAGLASSAGILFWVGRLLTKLYLSQHHLRQDAEERAVMTTTYLALTADKAATDEDRHIILSALFRPTSDGIVKEDGGLDPSLAAALGRVLAR